MGEKRRFRDVCDTGGCEAVSAQGPHSEEGGVGPGGAEKLWNKRKKETMHKQGGLEGKGKEKAVDSAQRKCSVFEADSKARKQQRGEKVGREGAGGGALKNKLSTISHCTHNRQKSKCKQCGGGSIRVRASPPKKQVQAMRRLEHLRAQPKKNRMQAMRRCEHLRAQPHKKQVQAMRRSEHLRAQPQKKHVQAMRWVEHLPASITA